MSNRAVLVTGPIRSGTTLIGRALATGKKSIYLHEPFNPDSPWNAAFPLPIQYFYISEHNQHAYAWRFKKLLELEPVIRGEWQSDRRAERYKYIAKRISLFGSKKSITPILKDPIALFSAEWLVNRYGARPVVVLRHPVDVMSSLVRLDWAKSITPSWIDNQPMLRDKLEQMAGELNLSLQSTEISQELDIYPALASMRACYLACCFFATRLGYKTISYESVTRHPVSEFTELFQYSGLEPSRETRRTVFQENSRSFDFGKAHQDTSTPVPVDYVQKSRKRKEGDLVDPAMIVAAFVDIRECLIRAGQAAW